MSSIILPLMEHGDDCPIKEPGAFGTFAHGQALPVLLVKDECLDQRSLFASASGRCLESDRFIASHSHHVRIPMHFQPGTQIQIATIDCISHDPGNGDLSLPNAFDHALGQFWLCLEAYRWMSMPAARHRSRSSHQSKGRYSSRSIRVWPLAVTYERKTPT